MKKEWEIEPTSLESIVTRIIDLQPGKITPADMNPSIREMWDMFSCVTEPQTKIGEYMHRLLPLCQSKRPTIVMTTCLLTRISQRIDIDLTSYTVHKAALIWYVGVFYNP